MKYLIIIYMFLYQLPGFAQDRKNMNSNKKEKVTMEKTTYQKPDDAALRNILTDEQYAVTRRMQLNILSITNIGMNFVKVFMSILRQVNLCSSLPINSTPAAAGPVSRNRSTKNW